MKYISIFSERLLLFVAASIVVFFSLVLNYRHCYVNIKTVTLLLKKHYWKPTLFNLRDKTKEWQIPELSENSLTE